MNFEQLPQSQPEDVQEMGDRFPEKKDSNQTPERLRKGVEKILQNFLKEKKIEGKEHLTEIPPDRHVIIVSSHFSNLDAPLIIDALGGDMNLQMAVMSTHFNKTDVRNLMLAAAGKESFSPLTYESRNGRTSFDPEDFNNIEKAAEEGNKVPWIAASGMKIDRKMPRANVGSAYLAERLNALVLPVAIAIEGSGASVEGAVETLKAFKNKLSATVKIGAPLDIPKIDVEILETVMRKRKQKEVVTPEEKKAFGETVEKLRAAADIVGADIAEMLPPEERGFYGKEVEGVEIKSPQA